MSRVDYSEFSDAANELVEFFGEEYVYNELVTTPNPTRPWETESSFLSHHVQIAFIATDRLGHEFLRHMGVTELPASNEVGIMAHNGFIPRINDIIVRDGLSCRIDNCNTWKPGAIPLLHIIEISR